MCSGTCIHKYIFMLLKLDYRPPAVVVNALRKQMHCFFNISVCFMKHLLYQARKKMLRTQLQANTRESERVRENQTNRLITFNLRAVCGSISFRKSNWSCLKEPGSFPLEKTKLFGILSPVT